MDYLVTLHLRFQGTPDVELVANVVNNILTTARPVIDACGMAVYAQHPIPVVASEDTPTAPGKTFHVDGIGPIGFLTLSKVYLFVYDHFSADTKEVAKHFGWTTAQANAVLEQVPGITGELISDGRGVVMEFNEKTRKANPGQPRIWQCFETYDSVERNEAERTISRLLRELGYQR